MGTLRDGTILCLLMLIMLIIRSSVANAYLSGSGLKALAQKRNSAGGHERPQRCWPTGVPGVSSAVKTSLPREIYASGGGILVASVNEPRLFYYCGFGRKLQQ